MSASLHPYRPTFPKGLGLAASGKRRIKDGFRFNSLFPTAVSAIRDIKANPTLDDTLQNMQRIILERKGQTAALFKLLNDPSPEKFLRNLFDFCYTYIQYEEDSEFAEQLRQPAAAWMDRVSGIDCDCFSIFVATTILHTAKLEPIMRVIKQTGEPTFHHVYIIVPKKPGANLNIRSNYWVIDPVVDRFDYEVQFAEKIDVHIMKPYVLQELSGLKGVGCASVNKKPCGCGSKTKSDSQKEALIAERNLIASGKKKEIGSKFETDNLVAALDYVIKYWDDEVQREEAKKRVAQVVDKIVKPGAISSKGAGLGVLPVAALAPIVVPLATKALQDYLSKGVSTPKMLTPDTSSMSNVDQVQFIDFVDKKGTVQQNSASYWNTVMKPIQEKMVRDGDDYWGIPPTGMDYMTAYNLFNKYNGKPFSYQNTGNMNMNLLLYQLQEQGYDGNILFQVQQQNWNKWWPVNGGKLWYKTKTMKQFIDAYYPQYAPLPSSTTSGSYPQGAGMDTYNPDQPKKSNTGLIIGIAAGTALLATGGYFLYSELKAKKEVA